MATALRGLSDEQLDAYLAARSRRLVQNGGRPPTRARAEYADALAERERRRQRRSAPERAGGSGQQAGGRP